PLVTPDRFNGGLAGQQAQDSVGGFFGQFDSKVVVVDVPVMRLVDALCEGGSIGRGVSLVGQDRRDVVRVRELLLACVGEPGEVGALHDAGLPSEQAAGLQFL